MERFDSSRVAKLGIGLGVIAVAVLAAFFIRDRLNRADVIEAVRASPSEVGLAVNSCNQNPVVESDEVEPGVYEVLVRTQRPGTGQDCADGVTISVDPAQPTITIVDRSSGESFELLGTGEPGPLGLNGVWRMTTVAIGEPVEVGVTTSEIPEITIEAMASTGVLFGNFGCNRLSIDVTFEGDTITGLPETLEGTEELCAIPDGGEQLVLTERSLLDLLSGAPVEYFLQGDSLEIGNRQTNAVFERIAG